MSDDNGGGVAAVAVLGVTYLGMESLVTALLAGIVGLLFLVLCLLSLVAYVIRHPIRSAKGWLLFLGVGSTALSIPFLIMYAGVLGGRSSASNLSAGRSIAALVCFGALALLVMKTAELYERCAAVPAGAPLTLHSLLSTGPSTTTPCPSAAPSPRIAAPDSAVGAEDAWTAQDLAAWLPPGSCATGTAPPMSLSREMGTRPVPAQLAAVALARAGAPVVSYGRPGSKVLNRSSDITGWVVFDHLPSSGSSAQARRLGRFLTVDGELIAGAEGFDAARQGLWELIPGSAARLSVDDIIELIGSRALKAASPVAPAHGVTREVTGTAFTRPLTDVRVFEANVARQQQTMRDAAARREQAEVADAARIAERRAAGLIKALTCGHAEKPKPDGTCWWGCAQR